MNRKSAYYRKSRLIVEASVRNHMALAKTCFRLGYPEAGRKHLSSARIGLNIMSQHSAKLERLP